jgi:hypothetical protein
MAMQELAAGDTLGIGGVPVIMSGTSVTSVTFQPGAHVTVNLSAANIFAMYGAPVQLLAAPGTGKSILIVKAMLTMTRTATAFANGAAVIIQYGSTVHGAGTQALDSTFASTVVTGSTGTTVSLREGAVISDLASTSIQNVGVYVSNGTGAFDTGTGSAIIDLWYVVQ